MDKQWYENQIDFLNNATLAYDEGNPIISDKEWDNIYFQVANWEKENKYFSPKSPVEHINFQVVNKLEKVRHNHLMLSLDKTKDVSAVDSFIKDYDYLAMCKMDGLTCSLRYINGKLVSAETRGNGIIGEDILHNAQVIFSIPKTIPYMEELIVDGEIICTYKDFEEFSNEYKNPRNFAAGSIRLLNPNECLHRKLTFVAWDVIKGFEDTDSLITCLIKLSSCHFITVPFTNFNSSTEADIKIIKDIAKEKSYPIDGVVFKFNSRSFGKTLGNTEHHFKNAIAYKFYDETYDTTLKNISWTMGRTGILTPVAVFEPVEIDGTIVERASLHNISIMKDLLGACAYLGEPVQVFKANQIIPQLIEVDEEFRYNYGEVIAQGGISIDTLEYCPICRQPVDLIKSESGVENYYCPNQYCDGKLINRLDHFCGKSGLDIKGLSVATLEKLIDWGWVNSIEDIFCLDTYKRVWSNKVGFGVKSVQNILSAIENSKKCQLDKLITGIGIPLIGKKASKDLANHFKTYENFRKAVDEKYDFTLLDGFGFEMYDAIRKFDYTDLDNLVNKYLTIEETATENNANTMENIVFCITGKLNIYKNRAELQNIIEVSGGKVVGSVTKNVNYLITNDTTSGSAKNLAAQRLNIPIITEQEFIEKFIDIQEKK